MYLTRIAGILATVFGVLFLLYIFAGCTLAPPELTGRRRGGLRSCGHDGFHKARYSARR